MAQALALFSLITFGLAEPGQAPAAMAMAGRIDMTLLAQMANVSTFTGFMLAAATAWGFFRHWWVLAKFLISTAQLYIGIFVLSPTLRAGEASPAMAVGAALMASAIAFQAWLSVAKPWGRTPLYKKGPTAPAWVFAATTLIPLADLVIGYTLGFPLPALSALFLVGYVASRSMSGGKTLISWSREQAV
ncbi:hypothetical protein JJ691_92070 [Kutzneria sp. CA-103260]|nr:hypothetical protein JJ691_92070 [Kutzneria sp. CA-103260]